MKQVILYSGLLISGIFVSQVFDLTVIRSLLSFVTFVCLAYIMIEVGLEFTIDKNKLKSYGWDYIVAATAAAFPWIFCAVYFMLVFGTNWKEALLIGRFAAPTSAGVLFAMLAAAGLGATWLFKKARVLAIFDDVDTVLFMIPLQMLISGMKPGLFFVLVIVAVLLIAAYRWLHELRWPIGKGWIALYGLAIVLIFYLFDRLTHIHIEVLLPAFTFGCILNNPAHTTELPKHAYEHTHLEPEKGLAHTFDRLIKMAFMFLVGCSLPKINMEGISLGMTVWHVVILTVLANLGKCFPAFCYRSEVNLKQRFALSIAMFPRGEVGAGVLLVALNYGFAGTATTLSALSLALNLLLTGIFISAVLYLVSDKAKPN